MNNKAYKKIRNAKKAASITVKEMKQDALKALRSCKDQMLQTGVSEKTYMWLEQKLLRH